MMRHRQRRREPFDVAGRTAEGKPFVVALPSLSKIDSVLKQPTYMLRQAC